MVSVIIIFLYIFGVAHAFPYTAGWKKKEKEEDTKTPIQTELTEELVRTKAHSAAWKNCSGVWNMKTFPKKMRGKVKISFLSPDELDMLYNTLHSLINFIKFTKFIC